MFSYSAVMKHIFLLALVPALPLFVASSFAAPAKKQTEPVPEKENELKKKYNFIGKLLEKEKLEPEKKDGDKKEEDKKGKKGKKGGRAHLLKFQIKEVIDGADALKPNLILLCVAEPGQPRNPNQVKGGQAEPGEFYRVTSLKKLVKEDKVLRLAACRLLSAKGKVGEEYPVGKTWNGSLPVKILELLPEEQRKSPVAYLGDNKSFTAFWKSFTPFDKKASAPQVDFSKNIVVVMKNHRHPEPIVGVKARLDKSALRVTAKKNFELVLEGRKVKDQVFAAFFVLPRKGILTIESGKNQVLEIKPPGFIYAD